MSTASPRTLGLARRLIALETAGAVPPTGVANAVRACEKLRLPLSKLIGAAGFSSLVSRAATMARAEHPSLHGVRVRPDGTLAATDGADAIPAAEAGVVLVAHLLGLLVTFIGEPVALELVRGVWPEATLSGTDGGRGEEL